MAVYSGAEVVIIKLATYLTKKGIENTIVTLSAHLRVLEDCSEIQLTIPSKQYPFKTRSKDFLSAVGLIKEVIALRTYVRKHIGSFDVINVHNFPAPWSVLPYRPCVWMCNELPELWNNPNPSPPLKILRDGGVLYDKFVVKKYVDAICVSDEANARRVIERYGIQPHIVYYGIDYNFFSNGNRNRALRKFNLHDDFVLLQVGWLNPQKNQLESIKAVEQLKDKIPNMKLVLVGSGHGYLYENMLKSYVSKKSLNKQVIFLSHLPREEVRDLYHVCHVLLHPVKQQGGWLAPFEALCASKPIIVSSSMTAATIIERQKIGIVTNDFAKAIWDVYNNPTLYYDMARRGKRWVADNLSWDTFGQRMVKVFESVL